MRKCRLEKFFSRWVLEDRHRRIVRAAQCFQVTKNSVTPLRSRIPLSAYPADLQTFIDTCWDENPSMRPTFSRTRDGLNRILGRAGDNIVDHLMKSMKHQTARLESDIAAKLREFMVEKQRSDYMLTRILPPSVQHELYCTVSR